MTEKTPLLGNHKRERSRLCPPFPSVFTGCLPRLWLLSLVNVTEFESDSESDSEDDDFDDTPVIADVPTKEDMAARLKKLRLQMKEHGIGVYIITLADEHSSEYAGESDQRRKWISGFTGSAGTAVVTLEDEFELTGLASMSTDGRYFLQAEKQLDSQYWKVLKQGQPGVPLWTQWAVDQATNNAWTSLVAGDPKYLSLVEGEMLDKLLGALPFKFIPDTDNLIDNIWNNRPLRSTTPVFIYGLDYAGESVESKLVRVRAKMGDSQLHVILALDEVAWLFNLRGLDDLEFDVTFFSYALVTPDTATVYVDPQKVTEEVQLYLNAIPTVSVAPYSDFYPDLGRIILSENRLVILPARLSCSYALVLTLPGRFPRSNIKYHLIILYLKAVKNVVELRNTRLAQVKDSLAFIIHASWLEKQVRKKRKLTEWQVAQKILLIRKSMPNFLKLLYETIALVDANAAIIHYAPSAEESEIVNPKGIFLLDSGGHYLEGTTDFTRTYAFYDQPSDYRKYYTLVLKGHLAVANAKFPPGSKETGTVLDGYARKPLWEHGLDYNHGTGHGIGACGIIHEGPVYISLGVSLEQPVFVPGATTSVEPGYYVDGEVGFRIESEVEVIECDDSFGKTRLGENFLGFGYQTRVPFSRRLIEKRYLSHDEIAWINEYHSDIWRELSPKLRKMGEKGSLKWLRAATKAL